MGHFLCRKVGKLPEGTDASLCGGVYDCFFFSVDFSMFEISGVFCNEEWWIMDIGVSEYGIYPPKKKQFVVISMLANLAWFCFPYKNAKSNYWPIHAMHLSKPRVDQAAGWLLGKSYQYKNIMMKSAFKYQGFWFIVFVESNSETIPHQIIKIWQLWRLWDHQDGAPAPNMVRNTLLIGRFRYVRGMVIPPLMGFLTVAM